MTSASNTSPVKPAHIMPPHGPRWRRWLAWLLVLILGVVAWFWQPLSMLATTASAYSARVGCSCHFVAGRPLKQCRSDLMPGMGPVMLSADTDDNTVTARYLLLFAQTARYREGQGCTSEAWEE